MSQRYKGAIISATPPTTSTSSASGEWTLAQQMQAQGASAWPVANPDPYFNQVSLLLHGDGTNGAQNNTFLDSSTNNFTITRYGNTTQGTFSPFSLAEGQWSNYFDGSGDYLATPQSSSFAAGTGDFCVEYWSNSATVSGTQTTFNFSTYSWGILIRQSGANLEVYLRGTQIYLGSTLSANTWTHVAVTRSGTTARVFINGVQQGANITNSSDISGTTGYLRCLVGASEHSGGAENFSGYISNVRYVVGTALYTSNFTPSTTPLTAVTNTQLLTCQSNRFVDNSANNFTITPAGDTKVTAWSPFIPALTPYSTSTNGGSAYFDGSGDYLSVPSSSAFAYGTGDFTWEMWIYPTASNWASGNFYLLDHGSNGGVLQYNSNQITFYDGPNTFNTGAAVKPYTWSHVAVTRSSATLRVFVNGVTYTYGTSDTVNFGNNSVTVGDYGGHGYSMFGYMTDVRIVKGTALYTANFTPPTAPLTAISGTSLLLNCTNAAIYDNAIKNDVETVGNAQISTSVKKYGTGSMYFDGTGDWLVIPASTELTLNADFTIEFWVNLAATTDMMALSNSGGTQQLFRFNYSTANTVSVYVGAFWFNQQSSVPSGTWTHVALTRSGSTAYLFINGVSKGTYTGTGVSTTLNIERVGVFGSGGAYPFNGYIDDLRITKGVARYTANFVPPIQAFPDY